MAKGVLATLDIKKETVIELNNIKKIMGFAPRSTSWGHTKCSHLSALSYHPSEGLTTKKLKYCHGKGSQVSSRGCESVHPFSPEYIHDGTCVRLGLAIPRDLISS